MALAAAEPPVALAVGSAIAVVAGDSAGGVDEGVSAAGAAQAVRSATTASAEGSVRVPGTGRGYTSPGAPQLGVDSQSAISLPSVSARTAYQPWPGTSAFASTTVPPASSTSGSVASIESTHT